MTKIYKIRKTGSNLFINKDNFKESKTGSSFKQLSAAQKNASYMIGQYSANELEIVEFELIQVFTHTIEA